MKESTLRYNDVDFFIYLSDDKDQESLPEVVTLDESWIPHWKEMAFKYDLVEFSTSIKPFCITHLFDQGYEKIVYLDPDIYVFNSLDCIFDALDKKSIILTPHCCLPINDFDGYIPEEVVSAVGIYNLGFVAFKNDLVGQTVTKWWQTRLKNKCYNERSEGLFVDQKWMDFIPGFFPNEISISNHLGLNVALWNIHERIIFYENKIPMVKNRFNESIRFPLVFFHFSGYDPYYETLLDKRCNGVSVISYPDLKPLIEEYRESEMKNQYDKYHSLRYSFNNYNNGEYILPLQRRLYRVYEEKLKNKGNPFDDEGGTYQLFKKNKLLLGKSPFEYKEVMSYKKKNKNKNLKKMHFLLKWLKNIIGLNSYLLFIKVASQVVKLENHKFLVKGLDND